MFILKRIYIAARHSRGVIGRALEFLRTRIYLGHGIHILEILDTVLTGLQQCPQTCLGHY